MWTVALYYPMLLETEVGWIRVGMKRRRGLLYTPDELDARDHFNELIKMMECDCILVLISPDKKCEFKELIDYELLYQVGDSEENLGTDVERQDIEELVGV